MGVSNCQVKMSYFPLCKEMGDAWGKFGECSAKSRGPMWHKLKSPDDHQWAEEQEEVRLMSHNGHSLKRTWLLNVSNFKMCWLYLYSFNNSGFGWMLVSTSPCITMMYLNPIFPNVFVSPQNMIIWVPSTHIHLHSILNSVGSLVLGGLSKLEEEVLSEGPSWLETLLRIRTLWATSPSRQVE